MIVPIGEGSYRVEWKPAEAGEHHIDVCLYGESVADSPFVCNVGDPERVTVRNMPQRIEQTHLGNPVTFESEFLQQRCSMPLGFSRRARRRQRQPGNHDQRRPRGVQGARTVYAPVRGDVRANAADGAPGRHAIQRRHGPRYAHSGFMTFDISL